MGRPAQREGNNRLCIVQGNTNGRPGRLHLLNKLIDKNKKEGIDTIYLLNDTRTNDMKDMRFNGMSAILVKDSALLLDKNVFIQQYQAQSQECLIAKVHTGKQPILLSTIYNRPGNVISEEQLSQIVHIAENERLPMYLLGDLNSSHTALHGNTDTTAV